ncbi:CBS domain-containing protein, partial [Bacillus subtilis]|uniref:CBS domain-containing protein n=2 Tax=Bacillaceae TaxID=186817 RepID=UPI00295EDC0D
IKALQQTIQKTVVFVTHDMEEAAKLGSRIGVMEKGEIVQIGSPQELRENPRTNLVKEMMGHTISPGHLPLKDVMMPVYQSAYVKERANTDQAELQYEINDKQELIRAFYHGVLLDDPLTLNRDSTLWQAFEALQKQGVPALPVTEGNHLIGTISYEDLAKLSLKTL